MNSSSAGIRRTSSKQRDIENGGGGGMTTSDSNGASTTNNTSTGNAVSGIDNFLHRLNNDADLNKKKKGKKHKIRVGGGGGTTTESRKTSDLDDTTISKKSSKPKTPLLKRILTTVLSSLLLFLIYDTLTSPPEKRLLGSHVIHDFLLWVKDNPGTGAAAFVFVYGMCVVFLLPGTPLTLGGGYVYKLAYGWAGGIAMATFTSMAGSLFGSVSCFILGRYIMRNRVRRWGRKYPLFDAIDVAVSENGFKIMCLLYLTPILPLGPVSYMVGTTSMPVMKFAAAKIAALPLMLLYVFIGASTDTFFSMEGNVGEHAETVDAAAAGESGASPKAVKKMGVDEETHRKMVLFGLVLSIVSMSLVSHFVKKELYKIFDKQKREKREGEESDPLILKGGEDVEMVGQQHQHRKDEKLLRRPRGHTDEENG